MPNCFGFVILDLKEKKTILVESPNGYLSFPKGKYENEKDSSMMDCALRELSEETGITEELIEIVPNKILSEYKRPGQCTIQYYIGTIKEPYINFSFDEDEIKSVKWYDIDEVNLLGSLKKSRKDIFKEVIEFMKLD